MSCQAAMPPQPVKPAWGGNKPAVPAAVMPSHSSRNLTEIQQAEAELEYRQHQEERQHQMALQRQLAEIQQQKHQQTLSWNEQKSV